MDARAADALAIAVGHSLPSGLVEATAEIERLRARVAELEKDNARLEREKEVLVAKGREGRMPFAPFGAPSAGCGTWRDRLTNATAEVDRLDDEADRWYEKYARATRCPPRRSLAGPYVRPSER